MFPLIFIVAFLHEARSDEYYGIKIGELQTNKFENVGNVWVANETILQITNFRFPLPKDDEDLGFFFTSPDDAAEAQTIYEIMESPGGLYSKPLNNAFEGSEITRLIIVIPHNYKKWKYFGVAEKRGNTYQAVLELKGEPPKRFCCISNPEDPVNGLIPLEYGTQSKPIQVLDSKTLRIPKFIFDGSKPPDAWIFVGKGHLDKEKGRRALVLGRDTWQHHCPLRENYDGSRDLIVRLPDPFNVYDLNYISVFCYEYAVDFGHITFELSPLRTAVPAYIPPIHLKSPPFGGPQIPC